MPNATRLDTDVAHWIPDARHYEVDGGYLVVVVCNFFTATGTNVFYADDRAGAFSLEPIAQYPEGTSHDDALINLGYDVIDTVADTVIAVEPAVPGPSPLESSVLDMLPPEIAQMVSSAIETTN